MKPSKLEGYTADFTAIFANHLLTPVTIGVEAEVWRLGRSDSSGSNTYSAYIIFTRAGIAIMGDVRFASSKDGAAICYGYTKTWFSGDLNVDYLAEKFGMDAQSKSDNAASSIAMLAVIQRMFRAQVPK